MTTKHRTLSDISDPTERLIRRLVNARDGATASAEFFEADLDRVLALPAPHSPGYDMTVRGLRNRATKNRLLAEQADAELAVVLGTTNKFTSDGARRPHNPRVYNPPPTEQP